MTEETYECVNCSVMLFYEDVFFSDILNGIYCKECGMEIELQAQADKREAYEEAWD